jgi:hypothetical protein
MHDLSTAEMTSLRGGFQLNEATIFAVGNVAIALPIGISVLSGGSVFQIAGAAAANISTKQII